MLVYLADWDFGRLPVKWTVNKDAVFNHNLSYIIGVFLTKTVHQFQWMFNERAYLLIKGSLNNPRSFRWKIKQRHNKFSGTH